MASLGLDNAVYKTVPEVHTRQMLAGYIVGLRTNDLLRKGFFRNVRSLYSSS